MTDFSIARRTVLKSAGFGAGLGIAGAVSTISAAAAQGALAAAETAPTAGEIWSGEYWAHKGGVKLSLWRKRLRPPKPGDAPLPVLFLVHGSSLSARSSYDLTVPGHDDYSIMNIFARYGYDVWTMDHDGYGYSGSSGNNSDIRSGVEDLKAAMAVLLAETGRSKFHFFGESSGSIRAALFAQEVPERVDRLMLAATTYKGEGAAEIGRRRDRLAELKSSPRRKRDAAMIRSIFSRDGHPGIYDPAVTEALVATEMKFGDTIPSGTYVDMAANLPIVDPTKVLSPVLMTRGEWDGNSTDDDLLAFFRQLPNGDRQYVILPNTAHSEAFSKNRQLLFYAMKNFLAAPAPVAS